MRPSSFEWYSAREIASAAGVPVESILAETHAALVPHDEAVRIGRLALKHVRDAPARSASLFSSVIRRADRRATAIPLAVSSTLHAGIAAVVMLVATFDLASRAASLPVEDRVPDSMRLVFLATPGPGGGGGGGGLLQRAPAAAAEREGRHAISSPLPVRADPRPVVPTQAPKEPEPVPLRAERLPAVVAPIITAPADARTRGGVLEETTVDTDSRGAGRGGGAGTGNGSGLGSGDGTGVGPGSGGGTGGGPFRPGSGIQPPRLLREVKADYTEEARQRGISGEVVLEIVVQRDGSVGETRVLHGLAAGLDERAVQAVRQWRFGPALRQGVPVDVIVEVSVEFKLR
jgi:TonB family protein